MACEGVSSLVVVVVVVVRVRRASAVARRRARLLLLALGARALVVGAQVTLPRQQRGVHLPGRAPPHVSAALSSCYPTPLFAHYVHTSRIASAALSSTPMPRSSASTAK